MKKIIIAFAALFLVASIDSSAQTTKAKSNEDKAKVKDSDGSKTKVKDNKIKSKDGQGNKIKIKAPAPVLKSFTTDYPDITDANWSNSRGNWTATYKVNGMQTVTTYHANGTRVDTKTTYPLSPLPQAVVLYQQNNSGYTPTRVILITRPDQPEVYELTSSSGTIYIDTNGAVTTYTPGK